MALLFNTGIENKILGVSLDTIFTTLVTISIFILGYLFNRVYEWRKEMRHFKDVRNLICSHLESLIEHIDKQIGQYKKFGEHLASHKLEEYTFNESLIQTDFLSNLPYLDIFQAFKLGPRSQRSQRIEAYNSMFQAIKFIERQNLITKTQFFELDRIRSVHIATWNSNNDSILRFHDQLLGLVRRNRVTPNDDAFFTELNAIVHDLAQQANSSDLEIIFTHFVEPIIDLVKRFNSDQRTDILSPLVLKSSKAHEDLIRLLDSYSRLYLEQSSNLEKRKEIIVRVISSLKFYLQQKS